MGIRFQVPAHAEIRILDENDGRSSIQRQLEAWAIASRGPSVAARVNLVGAKTRGDAAAVLALEQGGVPLDDVSTHMFMSRDLAAAREARGAAWNGEDVTNDRFDLTMNPKDLGAELMGWWGRTPGDWLGNDAPLISSGPVKNASRWFMMGADASVDAVSDRMLRAAVSSAQENGYVDVGAFLGGMAEEYVSGENIGNKPFWGAMANLIEGERVNVGTGYMAKSELAPEVQQTMNEYEQFAAGESDRIYNAYENRETDPEWDETALYANAYSESNARISQGRERAFGLATQPGRSPEQDILGDPITQASELKQESYGMEVGAHGPTLLETDENGNPYWQQVSWGRVMASTVSEPGSTPYNWISGSADFAKQLFADPLNYVGVGAVGKASTARRTVKLTEAGAERAADAVQIERAVTALREAPTVHQLDEITALKKAGVEPDIDLLEAAYNAQTDAAGVLLAQRARKTVAPERANRYLTGSQAQPMVTALTEASTMRQVDAILSSVKNPSSTLRGQLAKATTEGEVIDLLLPQVSNMNLVGNMNATARLASYASVTDALLDRPLGSAMDYGFRIVDEISNTALDRMYQIQQDGVGSINPRTPQLSTLETPNIGIRAQVRDMYGNTWGGRMVNNQSNSVIRTDNIDAGYAGATRLVRNMSLEADSKLARTSNGRVLEASTLDGLRNQLDSGEKIVGRIEDVDDALYSFSQLSNGNGSGAFDQVRKIYDAFDMKMEMDGIPENFRKAVSDMIKNHGENSIFFSNAMGETGKYPGVGFMTTLDGKPLIQPGPQLINEFFSGGINVPDPRLLRRTLAEKNYMTSAINALTTKKTIMPVIDLKGAGLSGKMDFVPRGNLDDATALRVGRIFLSQVWKPMKLLRFGYIPKVVLGDEQARMTAAGLASMWAPGRVGRGDSPLAYFAYLFGRKGSDDVAGNAMDAARQYQDTVSLNGNAFGETGAMRSETWERAARGSDRYNDGIATEIVQLSEDPVVQHLFSEAALAGDNVVLTKAWMMTDPEGQRILNVIARKLAETDPSVAVQFREGGQMLDNYLQWVNARAHLKAGGDYVFRDPTSGALVNSMDKAVPNPQDYLNAGDGITIIRQGDAEIMKAYGTGLLGEGDAGVHVVGMTDKRYKALREDMARRIDESIDPATGGSTFPAFVKHESSAYGYDHESMAHQVVDFFMDWTVSKPASQLNRNPTFKQFYWHSLATRIPMMTDEVAAVAIKQAKDQGVWGRTKAIMDEMGPQPKVIDNLKDADLYAKSYAATATKDLLFDFAERKNFFDAISLISPFADAWLELFTSWGRLFAQDPRMVRRPGKALDELRGSDPMEWGEEEFDADGEGFFYMNSYGEEVFAIPFLSEAVEAMSGAVPGLDEKLPEMKFEIATGSLVGVSGQLYPGVGPVVTVPAAGLLPKTSGWMQIREALAPFGMEETFGDEILSETIGASPSLKRFINAVTSGTFYGGEDERIFNGTVGYMVKDMLTSGEYTYDQLEDPDIKVEILEKANERAKDVYLIRSVTQFLMPAAPGGPRFLWSPDEIMDMEEDDQRLAIALQDSAKAYYDIVEDETGGDYDKATKVFTDRYGFNPTATLVSASTAVGKHGVTQSAAEYEMDNPDTFALFKNTAYFLHPDDPEDEFWTPAWEGQFASGTRVEKPVVDQLNEYHSRMGTIEYREAERQVDEALAGARPESMSDSDYDDLRGTILDIVKKDILERNPAYEATVDTYSSKDRQTAIAELRDWQNYSPLDDDPTQKAVTEFMGGWDQAFDAQLALGIGSRTAVVLPFSRSASSKVGGENWTKRMIINSILLDEGDELAKADESGYFATVWEDLIKPSIYDYRKDLEPDEPEEGAQGTDVEGLIEEVFG